MGEARGSKPGAPGTPAPRLRPAPYTARGVPSPGVPGPRPRGAAHLQGRGQRAVLTKQGQGHCKGARQPLAAARRSTRSSRAGHRSPHRPVALTPRRKPGVGGAWWGAGARGGCRPGRRGPLQEKVIYALLSGAPARGRPASPRRARTCRCHLCTTRSARAGGRTCEAGGLAAAQWQPERRRRGGSGGGGERSSLAGPPAGRAHSASRGLADAILR